MDTRGPNVGSDAQVTKPAPDGGTAVSDTRPVQPPTGGATGRPVLFSVSTGGTVRAFSYDQASGALTAAGFASNPGFTSFGAVHPAGTHLYTSTEAGQVHAFALDAKTGAPKYLTGKAVDGGVTHLEVDRSGRYLFAVGYGSGKLNMVALTMSGGAFGQASSRDAGRNAHQVRVHPKNHAVYVPCLGSNHVAQYRFDPEQGLLTPMASPTVAAAGGPRHMDFSPDGAFAYVLAENSGQVHVFETDEDGALKPLQTAATQGGSASDIRVSPDGKFVWAVFRASNQIATYKVEADGKVTFVSKLGTGGQHARSFAVSPSGQHLYVAHANGGGIARFSVDGVTGKLTSLPNGTDGSGLWFVGFGRLP